MPSGMGQSFGIINYSGMIYDTNNTQTPLLSILPRRNTSSVEFVINSTFATEDASDYAISETASLTAPDPSYITRAQTSNVVQIFQETTGVSYMKQANTGTLGGVNLAGQQNNTLDEFDFQMDAKTTKVRKSLEKVLIQGTYNKATTDATVNKTRGFVSAITSNVVDANGSEFTPDIMDDVMLAIRASHGPTNDGLVILCDPITRVQISNNYAKLNGFILPASRNVGGFSIDQLVTDFGVVGLMVHDYLPAGTALVLNLGVCEIVEMPTPGKGNFFWEELAKVGAGDKGMLYGVAGLDYGPEWYHAKVTGLATTKGSKAKSSEVNINAENVVVNEVPVVVTGG